MKPYLVFDIEIKKTLGQVATELKLSDERMAFSYPHKLGFGIGVVYNSITDEYLTFNSAKEMAKYLLENGDFLVSFNGIRFDIPCLLNGEVDIDIFLALQNKPHLDILQNFYANVGGRFRVGLDNIAQNTLGKGKTGNGADAPLLFQQGKIEELIAYCKNDVLITKEIYEFGVEQGFIKYWDNQNNALCRMEVDWGERDNYVI
jgi:DEAD/DEAH box helicase domain-containing protein